MEINVIIGLRTQSPAPPINTPSPPHATAHSSTKTCQDAQRTKTPLRSRTPSTNMARSRPTRRRSYRARAQKSTSRRTTYRKRTPYRRRAYAKRPSRKAMLNITSRKKRDTMLSVTYSADSGTTQATSRIAGTTINGTDGAFYIFCPTARDLSVSSGNPNVSQIAARTATTCYMRGFSEHLRIQTSSGAPWFHRRICLATRDEAFRATSISGTAPSAPYYDDTTRGMARLWINSANNNTATYLTALETVLFKGRRDYDWNDRITAPIDNTRVDLKYDKTFIYRSGNANGITRESKLWHPMNKNLTYDDDEQGDTEASAYYSVKDKRGMGDYYVIDIIQSGEGGGASDLMRLNNTSTLYWHER